MKSFRLTLVAAIFVAALVAVTLYVDKRETRQTEMKEQERSILKGIKAEDIERVEVANRASTLVLEKKENRWQVTAPIQDAGDPQAIETLLNGIENEKVVETVIEGANVDLKPYGLDQPVLKLRVTAGSQSVELKIGAKAYDNNLYALRSGEPRVILVSSSWDHFLSKLPKEFRDKHLIRSPFQLTEIQRITLSYPDKSLTELGRTSEGWQVLRGAEKFPLAKDKVEAYLESIQGLRAQSVEEADKKQATLSNRRLNVGLFKEGEKPTFSLDFEVEAKKDASSIRALSSDAPSLSFEVALSAFNSIRKSSQDFYDKKKPFQFDLNQVSRVKINVGSLKAEFVKKGEEWQASDPSLQNKFDSSKLNEILKKLNSVEAVRIFEVGSMPANTEGRLLLSKENGERVFELGWNNVVTEKATAHDKVEVSYRPAWTSVTNHRIAIADGTLRNFDLDGLLKTGGERPAASATPKP